MSSGYYVYCRAWLGFTDGFPFFDELNPYLDDKIVPEIELRALTWLRSNKPQVRKAYREERTRLQEVLSKPLPGEAVQPGSSPLTRKLTARLDTLSSEELTQLAEKLQVESRGSKTQIRRALLKTLHARLSNPESRGPTIDLLPPSFGLFSFPEPERLTTQVKRAMRGKRSDPLAVRITRLARWTDGTVRRLGGQSPTPTLYLGWLANEELARQVLDVCRLRSQLIVWHKDLRLQYGYVPVEILGVARAAVIEMDLKELQNGNHHWTGTRIHQAVYREYIQAVAEVCTVGLRGDTRADSTKRAALPSPNTISNREAAKLYADLTETKSDPSRIGKRIRDGKLAVEADGRTTEGAIARYAQSVLKKRPQSPLTKSSESKPEEHWEFTCPRCEKKAPKLMGAEKICRACFFAFYRDLDDTTG